MSLLGGRGFQIASQLGPSGNQLVAQSIQGFLANQARRRQEDEQRRQQKRQRDQQKKAKKKAQRKQNLQLGVTAGAVVATAGAAAALAPAAPLVAGEVAATTAPLSLEATAPALAPALATTAPLSLETVAPALAPALATTAPALATTAPLSLATTAPLSATPLALGAASPIVAPVAAAGLNPIVAGGIGGGLANAGMGAFPGSLPGTAGPVSPLPSVVTGQTGLPGTPGAIPGLTPVGGPSIGGVRSGALPSSLPGTVGPVTVAPGSTTPVGGLTRGPGPFTPGTSQPGTPGGVPLGADPKFGEVNALSGTRAPSLRPEVPRGFDPRVAQSVAKPKGGLLGNAAGLGTGAMGQSFGQRFGGNLLLGASGLIPGLSPIVQNIPSLSPQLRIANQRLGLQQRSVNLQERRINQSGAFQDASLGLRRKGLTQRQEQFDAGQLGATNRAEISNGRRVMAAETENQNRTSAEKLRVENRVTAAGVAATNRTNLPVSKAQAAADAQGLTGQEKQDFINKSLQVEAGLLPRASSRSGGAAGGIEPISANQALTQFRATESYRRLPPDAREGIVNKFRAGLDLPSIGQVILYHAEAATSNSDRVGIVNEASRNKTLDNFFQYQKYVDLLGVNGEPGVLDRLEWEKKYTPVFSFLSR